MKSMAYVDLVALRRAHMSHGAQESGRFDWSTPKSAGRWGI